MVFKRAAQENHNFETVDYSDIVSNIYIMVPERRKVSVRVRYLTLIENLPPVNTNISNSLMSHLSIRESSSLSYLKVLSVNDVGRPKNYCKKIYNLVQVFINITH